MSTATVLAPRRSQGCPLRALARRRAGLNFSAAALAACSLAIITGCSRLEGHPAPPAPTAMVSPPRDAGIRLVPPTPAEKLKDVPIVEVVPSLGDHDPAVAKAAERKMYDFINSHACNAQTHVCDNNGIPPALAEALVTALENGTAPGLTCAGLLAARATIGHQPQLTPELQARLRKIARSVPASRDPKNTELGTLLNVLAMSGDATVMPMLFARLTKYGDYDQDDKERDQVGMGVTELVQRQGHTLTDDQLKTLEKALKDSYKSEPPNADPENDTYYSDLAQAIEGAMLAEEHRRAIQAKESRRP